MINIYRMIDPETYKMRYIGQTINILNERLSKHCTDSRLYKHHTANWIKSLKKKGLTPIIELITTTETQEDADFMERLLIKFYRSIGYDLTNDHEGGRGGSKGRTVLSKTRTKISTSLQGNQRALGYKHTRETKDGISATMTGVPRPEGHGAKVSAALKDKPKSKEHKENLSAAMKGKPSPNKGKSMLDAQKIKISATLTGKPWSEARREAYNRRYK